MAQAGSTVWLENIYSPSAVTGVSVLVVAATLSLVAVVGMLIAISISSFKTGHAFIRSQLGAYFVSLIFAELIQATGSLMSARWIVLHRVQFGHFCASQGALKNAGNVSTALWSMVIAFHTFTLIFLKTRVAPWVFYFTLVFTWVIVGFVVILGPAALETPERGPFWGISGYWCWISMNYMVEQFAMEYLFMFTTAIVSTILYVLIFLRLRGNIEGVGLRVKFCRSRTPWQSDSMSDPQIARVGKTMLLYPVAYVVLILPIAACRWSSTYHGKVPFAATIFADTVFLLSGVVNATLYSTTRRVAPIKTIIPSYGTRNTEKDMESFGPRMSRSAYTQDSSMRPLGSAPGFYVKEYSSVPQPIVGPEESRPVLDGNSLHSSSYSVSSLGSVQEAGNPGPEVHHALVLPAPQPDVQSSVPVADAVESYSHRRTGSRSNAFEKDWI